MVGGVGTERKMGEIVVAVAVVWACPNEGRVWEGAGEAYARRRWESANMG